jgi:nicotinamidase-related amidase
MSHALDPASTTLLLLDFEPSTLGFLGDSSPLVAMANRAINSVRSGGGGVAFVRVGFTNDDYHGFPSFSVMGNRVKSARPGLDADAPGSALHPDLDVHTDDVVVRKTRVGAFSTTDLNTRLTGRGTTTVILAGVHTSGAVLTTVREAHDLDYNVLVLADACADPDPDVNSFLIDTIFPKQASVISVDDLPNLLA